MKQIFLLTSLFFVTSSGFAITIEKLSKFVADKGKCELAAVGFHVTNEQEPETSDILCIADIVQNEGTLNEKSGCAFVLYNADKDRFENPDWSGQLSPHILIIDGKSCSSGGFEELIEKGKKQEFGFYSRDITSAFGESRVVQSDRRPVLLYSKLDKYRKWFDENLEKFKKTAEQKKAKKEAGRKTGTQKSESKKVFSHEGKWKGKCYAKDDGGEQKEVVFRPNGMTTTVSYYEDGKCKGRGKFQIILSGTVKVYPGDFPKKIDLDLKSAKVVPSSQKSAQALSASLFCGRFDWLEGKAQDVSKCEGLKKSLGPQKNIVQFSESTMFFGDEKSPKEDGRPTQLDKMEIFEREK